MTLRAILSSTTVRNNTIHRYALPIGIWLIMTLALIPARADSNTPFELSSVLQGAPLLTGLNALAQTGDQPANPMQPSNQSQGDAGGPQSNGSASPAPGTPIPTPQTATQATTPPPAQSEYMAAQPRAGFELHGNIFERYRDDTNHNNGGHDAKSSVTFAAITGEYNLNSNYGIYVRFGTEEVSAKGVGRDFNGNYYKSEKGINGPAGIDQFGATYHNAAEGLSVTVGRQDEPLDATSTMYDLSWKVGEHTFMDGAAVIKEVGSGTLQAYLFSEDQYYQSAARNGLYALRGTVPVVDGWIVGDTVAHYQASAQANATGINSTTNDELDVTYKRARSTYEAEYGQSDYHSENELYYLGGKYGFTPHDDLNIFTYRIGANADIGHGTAYVNGYRGTRYIVEHFFATKTEIIFYYETDRQLDGPGLSDSFEITLQTLF